MPTYYLNGRPFTDTYKNLFYAKGMVIETKVFEFQFNVYEYDTRNRLVSLKVGDGKKQYKDLDYVFGKPTTMDQVMCSMATFYAFTNFVSQHYQTKGSDPAEADPVFVNSVAFTITNVNKANWNTAFNWGNHAGLYKPSSYVPSWSEISGKPTLYTKSEVDTLLSNQASSFTAQLNAAITNFNAQLLTQKNDYNAQILALANSLNSQVATVNTALAGKLSSIAIKSGTSAGPVVLLAGATANVVVNFATAFPDTNYSTTQSIFGALSLLGSVSIQGVTNKLAGSITVVLKNTSLLSINLNTLTVEVIAFKTT